MSDEQIPVPFAHSTPDGRQWISTDEYMLLRRAYEQLLNGLRDVYTAAALTGLLANPERIGSAGEYARDALDQAYAVLAERDRKEALE
jgi:hypothetical protein